MGIDLADEDILFDRNHTIGTACLSVRL
jgi:hypothetical protein